ncbi:MAG TPA: pitrilysin family protein [Candidatus Acidoferrales bacterium]|nr:pitrilysin family protein [Candidatus Acidoferrales bacterium]
MKIVSKTRARARWKRLFSLFASLALVFNAAAGRAAAEPDVLRATLANGLSVVIVRNDLAPVVTTQVNYLVGSNESPPGFPGTAHAVEHMMFRGSPGLSAAQLSSIMAAMGGHFNAATQQTVTQYFFTVAASDLETALRMRGIVSSPELWRQERGAIEQEVAQNLSNPQYLSYSRVLRQLFAATPYAYDPLGTRPSFQKTTAKMLRDFHRKWYAPNNAILVIAGAIEPKAALTTVRRLFENIPRRAVPARPQVRLQPLKPATIEIDTDLPYGHVAVAYRLPGYRDADFAAGLILADVLDSRRGELYALAAEGKSLTGGFDGIAFPDVALGFANAAFAPGQDSKALAAEMKRIVDDYVKSGFSSDLVEAAKRRQIAEAEFRKNSIPGLAAEWSQALAVEGRNSPDESTDALKRVSVADVDRVARKYLVNETATVVILTPRESGKAVAAAESRPPAESFAPREVRPVPLPAWAKKTLAPVAIPASRVSPAAAELANGLKLIVQTEDISDTVTLYGQVKNRAELQVPPGKEGVDEILAQLFSYGSAGLDRLAFQQALDAIGAQATAGTNFSLRVLARDFERGVELLADNLLRPRLPEEAFEAVRQRTAQAVAGRLQSPVYLSHRAFLQALYPQGDPALRQATPETVKSLNLEDVRAYYQSVFRPDLTSIVVIGRVTHDEARRVVEKYFGPWRAEGRKPETDLPPVPRNEAAAIHVPDSSRVQDDVTLGQTFPLTRQDADYYALQLGLQVLSGGFYASRLYRDLRERTGLVYGVEAQLQSSKTRSVFVVSYACDPPNVGKARALVERNLRDMQQKPVSPEELLRAKTLLLRAIPLSESSTHGIAAGLLERSVKDLPLDEPVRAARRYHALSAQGVRDAFARWIELGRLAQVVLGPPPK